MPKSSSSGSPTHKKRGRRAAENPKSSVLRVRVSEADKRDFEMLAEAHGVSVSTLQRALITEAISSGPALIGVDARALQVAGKELASVGRNLNQVARAINSRTVVVEPLTASEVQEAIKHIIEMKRVVARVIANAKRRIRRLDL